MLKRFIITNSKVTIFNSIFALMMLSFAFFAPDQFFVENGVIEMLEIATLCLAVVFCILEYKKQRTFKHVFLMVGILALFFIGRELSWGRVFFTDELGNIIKRKEWLFGAYVYYIVGTFAIAAIIYAYKTKFVSNIILLLKKAPILILDAGLLVAMAGCSIYGESINNYALEESAEVALYFIFAMIIRTYSSKNLLENIKK